MTSDTRKLKIAFVLDDGLERPDGVQQNILTLGKWLSGQGQEVHYLVGETKRRDIKHLHSMAKNIRVRFNGNKLTIPTYAPIKNIKTLLANENFDVLHVQMPYHPFCGARIVKAADSRTVIVGTFHILEFSSLVRLSTRLLGMYLHRNLQKFDYFMSVSPPARIFAKQSFKINGTVLPNPVEVVKFKPIHPVKRDPSTIRLIFVGRLVPRKGCLKLLEALHELAANGRVKSSFHLDVCGDGLLRHQLEKYTKEHDLEKVVTFHGFVSEQQKVDLLQRADIAVYPSNGGESFGIVLIEAMAAQSGVVLAGDNPGYRSVLAAVPESLFDANNEKELGAKLVEYIGSSKKRSALHTKQQRLVEQFDVETIGFQLLNIYKDCIDKKNSR